MKYAVPFLFFYNLVYAEVLDGLPAHAPVTSPRLRPDDMGSFHDPRGSCVRKIVGKGKRRRTKVLCFGRLHQGIDVISLDKDFRVFAIRGGRIVYQGYLTPGLGYTVIIEHEDRFYTLYGHLDKTVGRLKLGQIIRGGDILGMMGTSGNAKRSPYPRQVHIEVVKAPYFKYRGIKTLKFLKNAGRKAYPDGGVTPPHQIRSFGVIPRLEEFRECLYGFMHCTCPEFHNNEYCHEFNKDIRCPVD